MIQKRRSLSDFRIIGKLAKKYCIGKKINKEVLKKWEFPTLFYYLHAVVFVLQHLLMIFFAHFLALFENFEVKGAVNG
jgi:hypothetical protein